jgi:hypothetical protein
MLDLEVDCLDAVVTSTRYRSVQRQRLSRLHSAASHRCIQQFRVRLGRHLQAGCVLGAMMVYLIGFLSAGRPDPLADIISPAP